MKAYLIDFAPMTRVVAESEEEAIQKAISKILKNPEDYIVEDNLGEVSEDTECPFGTFDIDKQSVELLKKEVNMNKELINEKPIRDAWINLYNELLNALKTFVQNRGGEVDVEVVYHWYEDEAVNATRVKKLYINDEGELVWVRNSFD